MIARVLADPHIFPRMKVGEQNGKPIYSSPFKESEFYIENEAVYVNFTSSTGELMRFKYQYHSYDTSEYCAKHNVPLGEQPDTQPFEMLITSSEFLSKSEFKA